MSKTTIKSLLAEGCEVLAHVSVREMCSIKTIVNCENGNQYYWFSDDWAFEDSNYFVSALTRKDGSVIRGKYALQRLESKPAPAKKQSSKKQKAAAENA